jgi:hypothetical protein
VAGTAQRQGGAGSLTATGAMALRKNGGVVLALDDGFYFYDYGAAS